MNRKEQHKKIEAALGYRFRDRSRLERALTHSSYAHERFQETQHQNPEAAYRDDYERLEFLGDAVLGLAVADLLMEKFPTASEGELSRLRAGLVCADALADQAQALGLGEALLLGKGEFATGGQQKASILAAAYEAVIAAIYLDAGFETAAGLIRAHFLPVLENTPTFDLLGDYKTPLQEAIQAEFKTTPLYRVVREEGPDHRKWFEVEVLVNGHSIARGRGRSKKEAEQNAARAALRLRRGER